MKEFDEAVAIVDRLMAPGGCPWDREQTLISMRHSYLEEACEFIEAVNLEDNDNINEELGDLFLLVIFGGRMAEKEGRFSMQDTLNRLNEKLIRRHPHVFGDAAVTDTAAVISQWEKIKQGEKGSATRKGVLDGIPKGLPALAYAQKVFKKLRKNGNEAQSPVKNHSEIYDEDTLGKLLVEIVRDADAKGLDAEQALRKAIAQIESKWTESQSI